MYRSTAEEYTCLQIASHTATQSFLPRWLKPSRKILLHFKTLSTTLQLLTHLLFNSFLLCSEFFSIFAPQLLKASIVHRRVLHTCAKHVCIPTCSPSQDNIHIAIITLFSTSATKPLWPDQPSSNCSPIPAAHSCRPQCLSPLSPAMATPWPPHW